MANKLKWVTTRQVKEKELVTDGLECIARGDHPRMIERRLTAHLIDEPQRRRGA